MLQAVAEGETDAVKLAALADVNLRATPDELRDAFRAAATLDRRYRMVLQQYLDRLALIERHMEELERELARSLKEHEGAVTRLAQVPGLGVDSAQQIIAEVGPKAERFPSAGQLSSWVGTCPGQEESAEQSKSNRSPKGNRPMRRILNQAANAAAKSQGTVFEALYKRIKGRDPKQHNKAVWAVANHQSRVIWKILHDGVNYEERGNRTNIRAMKHRARRLARELRQLGYIVQPPPPQGASA
jgi:transposase